MKPLGVLWYLLPNGKPVQAKGPRPIEATAFAHEGDKTWTPIPAARTGAAEMPRLAAVPMTGATNRRDVNSMFKAS